MEYIEISAKTVNDALTEASIRFGIPSSDIEYEVIEKGSAGFLGIGSKNAVIKACKKFTIEDSVKEFLESVFHAMDMKVEIVVKVNETEKLIEVELKGDDMGILIGKRGQTLDSLQYLTNLAINKHSESYYKVKRTKRPVALEPMNPFERRVIHSALQNDRFVTTHSEGEEPYRHVVVTLKK